MNPSFDDDHNNNNNDADDDDYGKKGFIKCLPSERGGEKKSGTGR